MIKIRRSVFETNSSSMHSLSVIGSDMMNSIVSKDGVIGVSGGEFGWGYDELVTPIEKLSYLVTEYVYDDATLDMIKDAVKDYTGLTLIIHGNEGYIDHQSLGRIRKYVTDKQSIIDLVFNDKNVIVIDNDNH